MQYEVIKCESYWVLRLAVPGFTKDQIDPTFEQGWLLVKASRPRVPGTTSGTLAYSMEEKFYLGDGQYKVDLATLKDGILEFIISSVIPVENGNRITIQ